MRYLSIFDIVSQSDNLSALIDIYCDKSSALNLYHGSNDEGMTVDHLFIYYKI